MDGDGTSTTASGEHQATEGSVTPGSESGSGGTQTAADTFATERSQLQSRVSTEQSRADKAEARARELEAQIASASGGNSTETQATAQPLDADAVIAGLEARMAHRETMRSTANALKDEFAYANADLFDKALEFDTPEAFKAAVENSHNSVKSVVDKAVQEREAQLIEEVATKYGVRIATSAPVDTGQTPTGDPSMDDLARMSQAELDALEDKNPGVIDRVLRSAN